VNELRVSVTCLLLLALATPVAAGDKNFLHRAEVRDYIHSISAEHSLDQHIVAGLFADIFPRPSVIEAISKPAERVLTWRDYRPIFLTDKRKRAGIAFMQEHQALLQRAEQEFGVPASVIAAIVGVETSFGRIPGKHPALETLATLAFDYPPRAKFFRQELTEFLLLANEEDWDALAIRGSYAAAMGMPQFISSSYRRYAVDFDDDGQRNLFASRADVVGSVANYLAVHGWRSGEPVASRWETTAAQAKSASALVRDSLKPSIAPETVRDLGFDAEGERPVTVLQLRGKGGEETWVGYTNFYAITRYNHSNLYAMAVFQLSAELAAASTQISE